MELLFKGLVAPVSPTVMSNIDKNGTSLGSIPSN